MPPKDGASGLYGDRMGMGGGAEMVKIKKESEKKTEHESGRQKKQNPKPIQMNQLKALMHL